MAEYIDREETKKALGLNFGSVMDAVYANRIVDSVPTADVSPIRCAQWVDRYGEKYSNHLYECSACKGKGIWDGVDKRLDGWHLTNFCPHCGAMMEMPSEPVKIPHYAVLSGEAEREKGL